MPSFQDEMTHNVQTAAWWAKWKWFVIGGVALGGYLAWRKWGK